MNNTTKQWEEYTKLAGRRSTSNFNTLVNNSISRSISIQHYTKVKSVNGHDVSFYTSNYIFSRNSAYVYYLECGTYSTGTVFIDHVHYINIIRYDISTKTETTIKSIQFNGRTERNGSVPIFKGDISVEPGFIYFINDDVIAATFIRGIGNGSSTVTSDISYISTNTSIINSSSFVISAYNTYGNQESVALPASTIYDETSASDYGGFAYYNYSRSIDSGIRYYLYYASKRGDYSYIYPEALNYSTSTNKSIWDVKSTFKYKYKGNYIEYPGVSPCIFKGELVCLNRSGKICQYNGSTWIVNGVKQDHF